MATIYTTKAVYTAVSSQTIYSFGFDYLNKTFVKVKLGGQDLTYLQDYTVDEKTINLTNPPPQGVDLEIYRATSTEQTVQWEDSSIFRANTLNLFQTQLLHISQEALDGIRKASLKQDEVTSKWDAEGIQINNVGDPQESQDAVNLRYLSNLQNGYITQMETLIANAKNVAEADHLDYLNRFMVLLANAQGQADRAESEATRAYNEANRAKAYTEEALQISTGITDPITKTEVYSELSIHNTDETAHQPILDLINSNQTEANNKLSIHNTDESAHQPILDLINSNQTEANNKLSTHNTSSSAHEPILNAIKAITGMSSYDSAPSKTIEAIIPLLGLGGIVAIKTGINGYIKFANGICLQWVTQTSTTGLQTVTYPLAFAEVPYTAWASEGDPSGWITQNGNAIAIAGVDLATANTTQANVLTHWVMNGGTIIRSGQYFRAYFIGLC